MKGVVKVETTEVRAMAVNARQSQLEYIGDTSYALAGATREPTVSHVFEVRSVRHGVTCGLRILQSYQCNGQRCPREPGQYLVGRRNSSPGMSSSKR